MHGHDPHDDTPKTPAVQALYFLHLGTRRWHESGVDVIPVGEALGTLRMLL